MLSIFICEDIAEHKEQIEKIVKNFIMIENLNAKIILTTNDPYAIIEHLEKNKVSGLYFLDVDLKCKINGITLASKIREHDPRGFIAFITAYPDTLPLTFKHKVEALDFISKSDFFEIRAKVEECILNAHHKYTAKVSTLQRVFSFKFSDQIISIDCSDIVYFETSTVAEHKVVVHLINGFYEYRAHLRDIEKALDEYFFKCHKSFIVNIHHIQKLDVGKKILHMKNGDTCPVSERSLQKLKKILLHDPAEPTSKLAPRVKNF